MPLPLLRLLRERETAIAGEAAVAGETAAEERRVRRPRLPPQAPQSKKKKKTLWGPFLGPFLGPFFGPFFVQKKFNVQGEPIFYLNINCACFGVFFCTCWAILFYQPSEGWTYQRYNI